MTNPAYEATNSDVEKLIASIKPELVMLCDSEELTAERRTALSRIVSQLTPPNLLALIAALEDANALNKHLELAIRKAEGCSEALRRRAEVAEKRIAELEAGTQRLAPHLYRECVNELTTDAKKYANAGQLRERLSYILGKYIEADHPHTRAADGTAECNDVITCWSCKKSMTLLERSGADGFCPHCDAEIDMQDDRAADGTVKGK